MATNEAIKKVGREIAKRQPEKNANILKDILITVINEMIQYIKGEIQNIKVRIDVAYAIYIIETTGEEASRSISEDKLKEVIMKAALKIRITIRDITIIDREVYSFTVKADL